MTMRENDRDDRLLGSLGRLAADREAQAEAQERQRGSDDEFELTDVFRARLLERVEAVLETPESTPGEGSEEALGAESANDEPLRVERETRRTTRRWLSLAVAAAALVTVLGIVYRGQTGAVALPSYELRVDGAVEQLRSDALASLLTDEPLEFVEGNRLDLVLTPDTAAESALEAAAYLAREDGWEAVPPQYVRVSEQGAVRVAATVGEELKLSSGRSRMVVVLAVEGGLPPVDIWSAALAGDHLARDERWQAWSVLLELPDGLPDELPGELPGELTGESNGER